MIIDLVKYISGRCPSCGDRFYREITPFSLNRTFSAACNVCDSDFMLIKKNDSSYLIKSLCFVCDEVHDFHVTFNSMWQSKLLTLGCPMTGVDVIYIGDKKEVRENAEKTDEFLISETDGMFDNSDLSDVSPIFHAAIEIIHNRIMAGMVNCQCGKCEVLVRVLNSNIVLICDNCNSKAVFQLQDGNDLARLRNTDFIDLV